MLGRPLTGSATRPLTAVIAALLAIGSLAAAGRAAAGTPLEAVRVASGLAKPTFVTSPPGDSSRVFILELDSGNIKILKNGAILPTPFMTQSGVRTGNEGGLMGMAFHPDYAQNRTFYLHYSRIDGKDVLRRYQRMANDEERADTTTGVDLMLLTDPGNFHAGGWIGFGPDGYLYVPKGDLGTVSYSQSDTTRAGKMLRIDVDGGSPYAIPPTNPFSGAQSPKDEFWAYGLRNPWRCSFDRGTGDFYVCDVGESEWEELNFQPSGAAGGANYGWPKFEGYEIYNCPDSCDSSGLTRPVAVFGHWPVPPLFCAVVGGYVYRGAAIPDLHGTYFFGDFCAGFVYSLKMAGGVVTELTDRTVELEPAGAPTIDFISSFGEDAAGELYICDLLDGEVYKIVPAGVSGVGVGPPPAALSLGHATPNPSGGAVALRVGLSAPAAARLRAYDAGGRLVRTIFEGALPAGTREMTWDARAADGSPLAPGVYFLRLDAAGEASVRKVTLVR
jgi:glucose/arabinose dehydrogenase